MTFISKQPCLGLKYEIYIVSICTLYNRNYIVGEFHLLFQCETLRDQINKFLARHFINHPKIYVRKFRKLIKLIRKV